VDLAGDVGGLLHQHLADALPLLAGLFGDQRVPEHHLGDLGALVARPDELDAAPLLAAVLEVALAAAAGVDLGLEDHRPADVVEGPLRLGGRGGHDAARDGRPSGREQLFRLVFVDLHRRPPGGKTTLSLYPPTGAKDTTPCVTEPTGDPPAALLTRGPSPQSPQMRFTTHAPVPGLPA